MIGNLINKSIKQSSVFSRGCDGGSTAGPFDGHAACAAIAWLRKRLRARRQRAKVVELFPEKKLSPKKRRRVEESSTKAAADLLDKVSKKSPNGKDDA
jgi:hypothetical protein